MQGQRMCDMRVKSKKCGIYKRKVKNVACARVKNIKYAGEE